jgi:hypothetical protein
MSHGLAARPELPEEELVALRAVAEELLTERVTLAREEDLVPVWRFSGRWFNTGPYAHRRPLAGSR